MDKPQTDIPTAPLHQPETDKELLVLDIIEAGEDVTASMMERLEQDSKLRALVQEALTMREQVRHAASGIDVEARLSLFHVKHDGQTATRTLPRKRWRNAVTATLAIAAILAGVALIILHPWQSEPNGTGAETGITTGIGGTPTGRLFTATETQEGISLTSAQGTTVALSPATPQNSQVSLDDFRQALDRLAESRDVTLTIPYGKSADLQLPDGSVASLYPGSRLAFPSHFYGSTRVVQLYGQAYFKVAPDAAHPFIVLTDNMRTTVLGTEFDIDANAGRVVLVKGSVDVVAGTDSVRLTPAHQATLAAGRLHVSRADVTPYEYWRDGFLYFDNVPLRDIMLAIGRNFNLNVEFADTSLWHSRMRFITERNAGIDEALRRMNQMHKGHVRLRGTTIVVEE